MTNLVIPQGTDVEIRIKNVKDANGALITNWAGYSVKAQVRERVDAPVVAPLFTSDPSEVPDRLPLPPFGGRQGAPAPRL